MPAERLQQFIAPMLAKETSIPFDDAGWIYEIKWDGYRALAKSDKNKLDLYSRNGISFIHKYSPVIEALKKIKHNFLIDGEIVVLDEKGRSDFGKLQDYENTPGYAIYYYVFDLLSLDGKDTTSLPLLQRKALLKKLVKAVPLIRFSEHIKEKGKSFFKEAIRLGQEGIMAKKSDSRYMTGKRTDSWLKIKGSKTTEAIITGFTKPTGSRKHFGSLVLAMYDNNHRLVHIGQTGTGFDDKTLANVFSKLHRLSTALPSVKMETAAKTRVFWVKPEIVCEVKFSEWTKDKKLRHPVFLRLRDDKKPSEIYMNTKGGSMKKKKSVTKKTAGEKGALVTTGKINVPISHPDKLYWPKEKITKKMLVDYYQSVANYILPFLKDRPESLNRTPGGIHNKGFFHKDAGENAPAFIKSVPVYSESADKEIDYIICNDKATLAYLNNLGCIELNPWNSTTKKMEYPDYGVIDLDPSAKNKFDEVVLVAREFKKLLDSAGVAAYCKTSGSTGLHIYIPMGRKYTYEEVKQFVHLLCTIIEDQMPEITTTVRSLSKRSNKKIYLDFLQNRKGQTLSAVYCVRPKEGAPVSMPLEWKEVKAGLDPKKFNIFNSLKRIKSKPSAFRPVLGKGIDMVKCLAKLNKLHRT